MLNSHLCWNLPAATDVRTRFQTRHRRRISSRPWRRVFFFRWFCWDFHIFFWGGLCFFQDWTCFIWWNTMNWMVMWLRLFFRRVWFRAEMFSENGTCTTRSSAPNIGIQPTRMEILIVTCFYFGSGNLGLGWCPPKGDMEETQGTIRDPFAPVYSKVPSLGTHVVDVWICSACVYISFLGNNLFLEFLLYYICT